MRAFHFQTLKKNPFLIPFPMTLTWNKPERVWICLYHYLSSFDHWATHIPLCIFSLLLCLCSKTEEIHCKISEFLFWPHKCRIPVSMILRNAVVWFPSITVIYTYIQSQGAALAGHMKNCPLRAKTKQNLREEYQKHIRNLLDRENIFLSISLYFLLGKKIL